MISTYIAMTGLSAISTLPTAMMPGNLDLFGLLWSLATESGLEDVTTWIGLASMSLFHGPQDWF